MNKSANLIMALGLCLFCMTSAQAQRQPDPNQPQDSGVQMTLTHLSVTDQNFEMGWKIVNNTDHDVWICSSLNIGSSPSYEWFLDKDAQTLVIRRRFGLPLEEGVIWEWPPRKGQYVRLRPGQEKAESFSLPLPVEPNPIFERLHANARYAKRLILEIDFFNEDLRDLILRTVELAEILHKSDPKLPPGYVWDNNLVQRFFGGWVILREFNDDSDSMFRNTVTSGEGPIVMSHMSGVFREQVLRLEVDNVSIPYKSSYPPLGQVEAPSGVTTTLTRLDVNDTNLELSYKIKNNTDHDVWVCNGYDRDDGIRYFDRFMATDDKTLVLRRRYNLPSAALVERFPSPFRYLRLRPGQEKAESHSFILPVESSSPVFHTSVGGRNVNSAQRLAIEIGFYDEDLRALIPGVVDMAERIGYDASALSTVTWSGPLPLYYRFFGGFEIAGWFKNRAWFRDSVTSDGDEILSPLYAPIAEWGAGLAN